VVAIGTSVKYVILVAIAMIVIAVIAPIGIGLLSGADQTMVTVNGTPQPLTTLADPAVITLLTVLLPILAIVGIAMGFIPKSGGD
jgi:hypothetical protein